MNEEIKQAIKEYVSDVLTAFVKTIFKEKRMFIDSDNNFYYGVSEENVNKLLEKKFKNDKMNNLEEKYKQKLVNIIDNHLDLSKVNVSLEEYFQEKLNNLDDVYKIVEFPEIQDYQELKWFDDEAILINSDEGLIMFGSSAYMIPINLLKRK